MTWSPLACGILTGKYDDGIPLHSRASLKVNDRLMRWDMRMIVLQGYGWLKEKILNEEGRKQQNQLRELTNLASTFDCTIAQLSIGNVSHDDLHSD